MRKSYLFKVMKLFVLFMLVAFMQVSAASNAQTVTWEAKNSSFSEVIKVIRQQTGYEVYVYLENLKNTHPVTINAREMPLEAFLEAILRNQPLQAKIEDKTIILSHKPVVNQRLSERPSTPILQGWVTVVIQDTSGTRLQNASVRNQQNKRSGSTDERGILRIAAESGDQLVVSYVGFLEKTVEVGAPGATIVVTLTPVSSELDETVIIAYGTTTKRFNTGNVSTVRAAEIEKQPIMNPLMALQGRVPGLQVQALSSASSAPIKVEIRGRNSINPLALSEPLYVIDGIPQTTLSIPGSTQYYEGVSPGVVQAGGSFTGGQSILFNLNSKDIESISVLKDGDATAIYGSRAANGVILITTKKGTPGRTSLNVNVEQGLVMVPHYPRMLDLEQYLNMRREAFKNDGITPTIGNAPDLMYWDTTRYTDWFRELAGAGHHTNAMGSLTGGDNRTNFRLSGAYTYRVDLHSHSGGNTVATGALSTNHTSANKRLTLNLTAKYAYTKVDAIKDVPESYMVAPNAPPIYDELGNLNYAEWSALTEGFFPFADLLTPNIAKTNSLNSSLTLRYEILDGLTLSGSGRFATNTNTSDLFQPIAAQDPRWNPTGVAIYGTTKVNNIAFEPELNYRRDLWKGRLSVLLGGTLQSADTKGVTVQSMGYANDELLKSLNNATFKDISEGYSEYRYTALFGRINYNWDSKYIININGRRDGSSRFAPGKQFGNFGSVGFAWIASEEGWMKESLPSWLSFVKFRGSYAITGSDAIGDYEFLSRYSTTPSGSNKTLFPYHGIQPYVPIIPFNQQYHWESLKSVEGALNLGFDEDRINLELAWYQKRSGNQLTKIPTPLYTGFPNVTANWTATVQNRGVEAVITAEVLRQRDWHLNMMFNISRNRNILYSYPGIEDSPYATQYREGESLSTQYYGNLIGVDPLTGLYVYEDYNKDGKYTSNASVFPGTENDDRYIAIDMAPRFQGGLGADLRWRNLGLSFNFYFVNQMGQHPSYALQAVGLRNVLYSEAVLNKHWQKAGDNAQFARFSSRSTSNAFAPVDASFVRLNNLAFTYELSEELAQKLRVQNASFSFRVQNVFTLTAYRAEPEIRGGTLLPIPRVAVGALSFTF